MQNVGSQMFLIINNKDFIRHFYTVTKDVKR